MTHFRKVLAAVLVSILCLQFSAAQGENVVGGTPEVVQADWKAQYEQTKAQIGGRGRNRFPAEQILNAQATILDTDKTPLDVALRRISAVVKKLKGLKGVGDLSAVEKTIAQVKAAAAKKDADVETLYMKLRAAGRKAMLSNPLLKADDLMFVSRGVLNDASKRKSEYDGDHFCDQYYGHNGRKGGGLFILKNYKTDAPKLVNVVKGLKVPGGTNKGKLMEEGTFISPDLSWDGKTILFSWSSGDPKKWSPETRFSVFKVGVDGKGLTRLTDGCFDDFDPFWLPNGRVVFMSTRRYGFGRCHGRPVPAFTMFSIKPDGSDMYSIDFHETNEFHPSVDNRGMIVYTRWDYVDRDHNGAHHMWHCYPDGRDPRSFHSNYAYPFSTVDPKAPKPRGINMRPWAEFNCRSIPGSNKYVATAGPHHGQAFGSLVLIDISVPDDNKMSQTKRITPDVRFPESEGGTRGFDRMTYGTAWALSESFYLCNYKDTASLIDEMGNREILCKTTNGLRILDPTPVRARTKPPIIATQTYQGERLKADSPVATISVMNVYTSDEFGKLPKGSKIKQMRIVQVLPKSTPRANNPRMGRGDQSLGRIPLGVVPVESDGSVFCKAPVGKAIYFQLVDENGMAVQSMRSVTYVHPGERLSCIGCHEDKWGAPTSVSRPLAMRRAPSELGTEVKKHVMFSFHRNVRPVLEGKCVKCHQTKKDAGPKKMAFGDLGKYTFYFGHGYHRNMSGGTRTHPGKFGAMFSGMGKALMTPTHIKAMKAGKFTDEDRRGIFMWLDMNSNELVAYKDVKAQQAGEIVWPEFDVDPKNYTGVEKRSSVVTATPALNR
ncbi:MAG: hypothetical protein QGG42_03335 [Phycisphaerae bacterium]|jgi:hypothetical protein|nr:hypothetical protein [Phycisphaerae bacterium]